jgi:hypothetical protein
VVVVQSRWLCLRSSSRRVAPHPLALREHHLGRLGLRELRLCHGGGRGRCLLLVGALDQVQLSLEELPCQNLLLRSPARWRQIAARNTQDGIAVVDVAIHAVAIATEVDLLLRQLGVVESKLPRPLNRLVRGGGMGRWRTSGRAVRSRPSCERRGLGGGRRGLDLLRGLRFGTQRKLPAATITAAAT